jgi:hypothetical protein
MLLRGATPKQTMFSVLLFVIFIVGRLVKKDGFALYCECYNH